jgi:phage shock protein A
MKYQTRMATEVEKWVARLNARVHGASRSRPVASAQYWLLGKIGSWATGPGLEAAYRRLLLTNSRARRAGAGVATSRKRLELRIGELERQADEREAPGGEAMDASQVGAAGQDQATRGVTGQLAGLRRKYADMQAKEQRVHAASRRLNAEVNAFRASKDAIKAAHRAAGKAAKAVQAAATGDHPAQDDATGEGAEPR